LEFQRRIALHGPELAIEETVQNVRALDRAIAWTEHVTIGPPFVEHGVTQLLAPATRSYSLDTKEEFLWPKAPVAGGSEKDLRTYTDAEASGGFTTHLMDPQRERAFFLAYSPKSKVLFGYVWNRADFPWLGMWEENRSRKQPPWNGETITWGLEFGVSPLPESRRTMIHRNNMFGVPTYRWAPARTPLRVRYHAFIKTAERLPETLDEVGLKLE
jgi:hypothetical protein